MNYRHIIIIINTAVINKNSEQLYFKPQPVYLENVSFHVFHYRSHKKNIKENI